MDTPCDLFILFCSDALEASAMSDGAVAEVRGRDGAGERRMEVSAQVKDKILNFLY